MENWKQIVGYERYFVSDQGRIKNIDGKILYLCVTKKGYNRVQLHIGNRKKKLPYVHRLVAKAFIRNDNDYPQVNHKDTNKKNNHVDNLEWCTNQQNSDHAIKHGLKYGYGGFKGEENPRSTITLQQAKEIKLTVLNKNFTRDQLCKKYGVSVHIVKDIRSGRSWNYL